MRTPFMLSRTADSLYWLGRYLERAEHTARLLDVHLDLMLDQPEEKVEQHRQYVLAALDLPTDYAKARDEYGLTYTNIFDPDNPNSVKSCISAARENARQVREQISTEMWNQINQFYLNVERVDMDAMWSAEPQEFMQNLNEGIHLFHGITDSTMNHGEGWYFVEAGRFIERAISLTVNMSVFYCPQLRLPKETVENPLLDQDLYWLGLLRSCTGFEAYCKVYTADLNRRNILEFLLLNPYFPHSVTFAVTMLHEALRGITDSTSKPRTERAYRRAGRLHAELQYAQVDEIDDADLPAHFKNIVTQCHQIHNALYDSYISYELAELARI
ncbi:MAG: alpha-E domain-containing protein [Caldilineaceae bacterium]